MTNVFQTWKLCNTARFISTIAKSFQREVGLFVSRPIRFATGCQRKQSQGYQLNRCIYNNKITLRINQNRSSCELKKKSIPNANDLTSPSNVTKFPTKQRQPQGKHQCKKNLCTTLSILGLSRSWHFSIIRTRYAWKMCSNYPGIKLEPVLGT